MVIIELKARRLSDHRNEKPDEVNATRFGIGGFRIIENEAETHVYTAEGCRADTPAATAAAAADLRVQFADLPNRCDVGLSPGPAPRS